MIPIDRARFLLLTASMAGGACASAPATSRPSEEPLQVAPPPMMVEVAAPVSTPPPDPPPPVPFEPPVEPEPPPDDVEELDEEFASSSNCDNAVGSPGNCSSLRPPPGPHCESFDDTKDTCETMRSSFAPRVAEKAVSCLLSASGTKRICDFQKADACAISAMRASCIDARTARTCRPIVDNCSQLRYGRSLSMTDCQIGLSSVRSKARDAMISCIAEGCSLDGCIYYLH